MKKLTASVLAGLAVLGVSAPAFADETAPPPDITITGAASIVSQYRFRGISQSDNKPAVQATFTVAHKSGFYLSTWGSSATGGTSPIQIGGTEIDVYGGFTHGLGSSGVTIDVGGYGYIYPGAPAGNYYEIYGSLAKSYGPVTGKVGVFFAPDQKVFDLNFTSPKRSNAYVYGELSFSPPGTPITLHSHLGHTGGGFDYGKQYLDYSVGASYKYKALTFDLSVVGTNITRSDVAKANFSGPGAVGATCGGVLNSVCTETFRRPIKTVLVGSVTASF